MHILVALFASLRISGHLTYDVTIVKTSFEFVLLIYFML